jgi:hypothetical protein
LVENKRLGAVLATIQLAQAQRDVVRLASPKMTLRQKERIRASRPAPASTKSNDRKREREFAAAKARGSEWHPLGAALLTHKDAPHP